MEAMAFNQNVSICWLHVLMNLLIAITDLLLIIRYMINKIVPIYMNICEYIKYGGYMNYGEYTNNAGYVNYGVYVNCGEYVKYDGYVNYSGYMNYGRYMNYGEIYAVFLHEKPTFCNGPSSKDRIRRGLISRVLFSVKHCVNKCLLRVSLAKPSGLREAQHHVKQLCEASLITYGETWNPTRMSTHC